MNREVGKEGKGWGAKRGVGVRIERAMSLGVVTVALAARGGVPALSCPLTQTATLLVAVAVVVRFEGK